MDPAQQHTPNSKESRLAAMECTYANSKARNAKQFDILLNGFLKLEKMMQQQHPPPTPPKNPPIDITSVQPTPIGQPLPPALPNEYDRDQSKGQAFLTSCQTYIRLCSDSFHSKQTKITWALSYMKSGRAAKWAEQIFHWEEKKRRLPKIPRLGGIPQRVLKRLLSSPFRRHCH